MANQKHLTDGIYTFDAETGMMEYCSHSAIRRRFRMDCWGTHRSFDIYGVSERYVGFQALLQQILLEEVNRRFFNGKGEVRYIATGNVSIGGVMTLEGHCICRAFRRYSSMLVDFCHLEDVDMIAITDVLLEILSLLCHCERIEFATAETQKPLHLLGEEKEREYLGREVTIELPFASIMQVRETIEQIYSMINISLRRIQKEQRALEPHRFCAIHLAAAAHIAVHIVGGVGMLDIFSCQPFQLGKILDLLQKNNTEIGKIRDIYCGTHLE